MTKAAVKNLCRDAYYGKRESFFKSNGESFRLLMGHDDDWYRPGRIKIQISHRRIQILIDDKTFI